MFSSLFPNETENEEDRCYTDAMYDTEDRYYERDDKSFTYESMVEHMAMMMIRSIMLLKETSIIVGILTRNWMVRSGSSINYF